MRHSNVEVHEAVNLAVDDAVESALATSESISVHWTIADDVSEVVLKSVGRPVFWAVFS